jgi:hypothetical protein
MTVRRPAAGLVAAVLLAGCAVATAPPATSVADVAGEWRGRWLGPAGHAMAALSVKADGAYRMAHFLDGGDRVTTGVVMGLPSGRLRYVGTDGNGTVHVESASGAAVLRFVPDGGGGGGTFRRAP